MNNGGPSRPLQRRESHPTQRQLFDYNKHSQPSLTLKVFHFVMNDELSGIMPQQCPSTGGI
jgi:hypothetical protein